MTSARFPATALAIGVLWACAGFGTSASRGAEAAPAGWRPPEVRLPLVAAKPAIDGEVQDDEWSGGTRMERFGRGPELAPQEATFRLAADAEELFVAVVSETPPGGRLLSRVNPLPGDTDARTFLDDSVELVLDPLRGDKTDRRRLYHAIFNARGAVYDQAYSPAGGGVAWRGHWRVASKMVGDRWHFELALPWKDMGVTADDLRGRPMGVRVGRNWQRSAGPEQTEWSPLGGAYLTPETMPLVTWDPAAPVVQMLQLRDPATRKVQLRMSVRNPGAQPIQVRGVLEGRPAGSAPARTDKVLTLAPGAGENLEVGATLTAGESLTNHVSVTSHDGRTVFYRRDWSWNPERPAVVWRLDADADKKVDLAFAYFPYHDRMKVRANVAALAGKDALREIRLQVRSRGAARPLAETTMPPVKSDVTEADWSLPPLADGEYELVANLQGLGAEPVVFGFVRHHFPWERNVLGTSDVLVPPFTAMTVEGSVVGAVGRRHTIGDAGLWDQVESVGEPLLAAPMRLEVTAGGKTEAVAAAGPAEFAEHTPTRVVARAAWSAPAAGVAGATRCRWDYDGVMKCELDLGPATPAGAAVDAVTLVIPLRDREAPLMHVSTDGLRFNYAGKTPTGEGRVWDGSKAARNSIVGSYVPYVWLGGTERGVCVFGDNDRGWVTDPAVPCQEIVRRGDTLELRLNLVARPTWITDKRTITLGFQATPTKPMPADWRAWQMLGRPPEPRPAGAAQPVVIGLFGSCYTWGALSPCLDLYPRDEDFSLWEKLAETRRTGVVDQAFLERWLAGYRLAPGDDGARYPGEIGYAFRVVASKPDTVLLYTNARGVRLDTREGRTFLDEWHRDAFPTRTWAYGQGPAYDLDPVESYRDYAAWHYHKMLTTFADAVYWDDIFPQSNFDLVGTDAYLLPAGTVQPSVGIWNMRELVRRGAVLAHELGKPNRNMVHITNTAVAPILSFAGTSLTWEDRVGDADFQDRFSRDYVLAESIGRQHGTVPFVLPLAHGNDPAKVAWARRTGTGAALVHELGAHGWPEYAEARQRLLDFGYGGPDVRVSNYWQPDHPVKVEGSDCATLVAGKPGRVVVVVCDYGDGGNLKLRLDAGALGLTGRLTATDMEAGTPLEVGAGGVVLLPIKRHDFRMVLVEAAKEAGAK